MIDADCRVLSWNLWWRFGDWQSRQPLIAAAITEVGADIVALQESWRTGETAQSRHLADVTGLDHVAWSPNRQPDRWRSRLDDAPDDLDCGLTILSRWPIRETTEIELPNEPWPPSGRTALAAMIEHPRGLLPVVTTHLEPHAARSALRVEQLNAVAELVHELTGGLGTDALAPIVCGDMNAEPHSDEMRRFSGLQTAPHITDQAFQDSWNIAGDGNDPGWTWRKDCPLVPEGNPNARIDYVLVGLRGRVASAELVGVRSSDDAWPSDHAGIVADLRP